MEIRHIRLNQYRNYEALDMRPAPGANVIFGENGQGKTNLVEALFLCALFRSHRTAKDAELIEKGCAGGYVGVTLQGNDGEHLIEIKLREGERKHLFIDRLPASRSGELMGLLNVVMFSPEDLTLVKGAPAERRRFMDMALSQQKPAYFMALQRYNTALRQRNALLKSDAAGRSTLFMWDEQMAAYGAAVMLERAAFLRALGPDAAALHASFSGGRETLEVGYRPNIEVEEDKNEMTGKLLEALEMGAEEDLRRGFTGTGPHRDDMDVRISGADARVYGSQGQQRTAALALKLCEVDMLYRRAGEYPVLLLDDALSELDDSRGRFLLESLRKCQSFLTCTSADTLRRAGLTAFSAWRCQAGHIEVIEQGL